MSNQGWIEHAGRVHRSASQGEHAMSNQEWIERAGRVLLGNYRPAPVVFAQGSGCRLVDVDGRRYLDLCGGIAVVSVGHGHPALAAAIAEQAQRLLHVSNLFYNQPAIELAEALVSRTGFARVFFCNSGAEANEALFKLARRVHYGRGDTARTEVVAMQGSFHGRTLGALSLTGQTKYHEGMAPLVPGVTHVPAGDVAALRAAVSERTAAVFIEPVQGEGGVVVVDSEYLAAARSLCDAHGALLFFDEVQTGFGRTGRFLAREHSGVWPDGCALAKGIASGVPLGAIAVGEALAQGLPPGSHASTFGGNPLACSAALAVMRIFEAEGLVERAASRGERLSRGLRSLVADPGLPSATGVRGVGLLQGLVLSPQVSPAAVLGAVRDRGVLLSLAGGDVLRFTPPLSVSDEELDEGLDVVRAALQQVQSQAV